MKNSLFNPDNWLWQPFAKIADFLILSALWIFSSIPIVTIGSAFTSLYDCSAHCVKDGDKGMISRYFRTFFRELLPSLLSFLFWALIIGGLITFIRSFTATADPSSLNLVAVYAMVFVLVLVVGIAAWVFPLLSRFTFGVVALNLTSLRLAIAYLPRTLALGLCTTISIWLCLRFWIPLMIMPGVYGLLSAHILEPVFKKYEEEQKDGLEN